MSHRPLDPIGSAFEFGALDDLRRIDGLFPSIGAQVSEASRLAEALRGPISETQRLAELMRRPVLEAQLATQAMRRPLFDLARYMSEQQQSVGDAMRKALLLTAPSVVEIGRAMDSFRPAIGEAVRASEQLNAYVASLGPDITRIGAAVQSAAQSPLIQEALRAAESISRTYPELFATPALEAFRDTLEAAAEQASAIPATDGRQGADSAASLPQISRDAAFFLAGLLVSILILLIQTRQSAEAEKRLYDRLDADKAEQAARLEEEVSSILAELLRQVAPPRRYVSGARQAVVKEFPQPGSRVVSHIQPGQLVWSDLHQGKWIRVEYPDGEGGVGYGWALKKYFKRVSPSP